MHTNTHMANTLRHTHTDTTIQWCINAQTVAICYTAFHIRLWYDNRRYTVRVMAEHCIMCINRDIHRYIETYIETYTDTYLEIHRDIHSPTHAKIATKIHPILLRGITFYIVWHRTLPQCWISHCTHSSVHPNTHSHIRFITYINDKCVCMYIAVHILVEITRHYITLRHIT